MQGMEKLLLIGSAPQQQTQLKEMLPDAEWTVADTVKEGLALLQDKNVYSAILVDTPSRFPEMQTLCDTVDQGNNYIFAIAILVLTDGETMDADLRFLGGAVTDCLMKPVHPEVFRRRLRNAEEQMNSVSFAEFARMLKVLPANIYLKDAKGRYVFSSQTWHHLDTGGDSTWTIRGKTDLEIRKDQENARLAYESDLRILRTGKGTSYIIEENDEGQEFLQLIKEPLFFPDGRVRGIIALINNVTEQELLRRELKERSIRDQMTGLYNRTFLDEYICTLVNDGKVPLSVISADCDNLKIVNDTYGHMIGDEYIRMCVTLLREILPDSSRIFRMGGDEFLAFIPDCTADKAQQLIEAMQQRAPAYSIRGMKLSVSLGCSTMLDPQSSIVEGIKRSDSDMYCDKRKKKKRAAANA